MYITMHILSKYIGLYVLCVCIHLCMYVHIMYDIHIVCMYVCMYVCMCVMYVCMHVYVCQNSVLPTTMLQHFVKMRCWVKIFVIVMVYVSNVSRKYQTI